MRQSKTACALQDVKARRVDDVRMIVSKVSSRFESEILLLGSTRQRSPPTFFSPCHYSTLILGLMKLIHLLITIKRWKDGRVGECSCVGDYE